MLHQVILSSQPIGVWGIRTPGPASLQEVDRTVRTLRDYSRDCLVSDKIKTLELLVRTAGGRVVACNRALHPRR